MRKTWILPLLALLTLTASAAERTVFVGENAGDAVVLPEDSGYALAYGDFAPGPVVRFARYDTAGNLVAGPVTLVDSRPFQIDLKATGNGYLFFARFGLNEIRTLPLGPDGDPAGPWQVAAASDDLHQFGVTERSRGGFILVWPEETSNLLMDIYSRAVGPDGTPAKDIHLLSTGLFQTLPIFEAGVVTGKKGPLAFWLESLGELTIHGLHGDGRPQKGPVSFAPGTVYDAEFGASGFREAGLYSVFGSGSRDLVMKVRNKGKLQDPVVLADAAYHEGAAPCTENSIRVSAGPDRFGVTYGTQLDIVPPCTGVWFFAEFDYDGNRIGPLRNLRSEGMDMIAARLTLDEARGQYVLSWVGSGPNGGGGYFSTLDPAP